MNCKELHAEAILMLRLCLLRLKLLPELRRLIIKDARSLDAIAWAPEVIVEDTNLWGPSEYWKVSLEAGWKDPLAIYYNTLDIIMGGPEADWINADACDMIRRRCRRCAVEKEKQQN